jgi:hypothetical protein
MRSHLSPELGACVAPTTLASFQTGSAPSSTAVTSALGGVSQLHARHLPTRAGSGMRFISVNLSMI